MVGGAGEAVAGVVERGVGGETGDLDFEAAGVGWADVADGDALFPETGLAVEDLGA